MKVYFESCSANYEGDYPSITIHYRPQDRQKAERIRYLIESGRLDEDTSNKPIHQMPKGAGD